MKVIIDKRISQSDEGLRSNCAPCKVSYYFYHPNYIYNFYILYYLNDFYYFDNFHCFKMKRKRDLWVDSNYFQVKLSLWIAGFVKDSVENDLIEWKPKLEIYLVMWN